MLRWKVVYKDYTKAVENLYSLISSMVKYSVVCDDKENEEYNTLYIGLNNELEGFRIRVFAAEGEKQRIEITARDEINLMYAVSDFKNIYIPYAKNSSKRAPGYFFHKLFADEPMKEYDVCMKPRIKNRGLWTWGYVIYNYKKYIDNMVKLKLNTLIIWNDYLPENINDVINYAHDNGVKLYLGFAWGWDTKCNESEYILNTDKLTQEIKNKYEKEYSKLNCDGIYFQSFTEMGDESVNGKVIAQVVTDFVNKTADEILKEHGKLEILFGLHATSVKNKLDIIKNVDERISIIWEDVGSFPYSYSPADIDDFEETKELNNKLQNLRNGGFGAVLKGVYCLDWSNFEHQKGNYILGTADEAFLREKVKEKRDIIKRIQSDWIRNAKYAHEIIKDFNEDAIITVLAEDGVFEEVINYPIALYAQMLWDSDRTIEDIMCETAHMTEVEFV